MATITGTSGNNIITDPAGTDTIDARSGDDTIRIANGNFGVGETISGGSGNDTIALTSTSNAIDFSTGEVTNVEKLTGGPGNDVVTMSARSYSNFTSINLGSGGDVLNVKVSGFANITGLSTPSFTSVENRNLIGTNNLFNNIILTGDQLNAFTSINFGGGSGDAINLASTSTRLNSLSDGLMNNVEIISAFVAGSGVIINLSNQTEGFVLTGSTSGDVIYGGNGDDSIVGITGNDNLIGGSGNDLLHGGLGNDNLSGGSGADKFLYLNASESSNSDTITDFQHGIDKIDIAPLLGLTDFQWGGTTPTANGVWVTHTGSGINARTHVWADTNGNPSTTEFHISLVGDISLNASDFLGIIDSTENITPTAIVTSVFLSADTGSDNRDFITNTRVQDLFGTYSGSIGAGETLEISLDNGVSWQAASTSTGNNWTLPGQNLQLGENVLWARVTNIAGNSSTPLIQSYVLDQEAPDHFDGITFSEDTGIYDWDHITRSSSQTITAELTLLASTDSVYGSLNNGATWIDITSMMGGTARLTWTNVPLDPGSNNIKLKVTDIAGNDGLITDESYILDQTAPTNLIFPLSLSFDSGRSSSDFVTNADQQIITGILQQELTGSDIVYGSLDNGATWIDITNKVSGKTLTWNSVTLLAGSNTLKLKITDIAGNDGQVADQLYVLDQTAPFISFSTLALSEDTGINNTDFITRTAVQIITATLSSALASTDSVYGSLDNGATWVDITTNVSGTALAWDNVTLPEDGTFKLKVTDTAGNDGVVVSQPFILDQTAPTASVTGSTIANSGFAVVQSSEVGSAYLVKDTIVVSDLANIISAGDNQWNVAPISSINTDTNLAAAGLIDGTYKVYTVDAAGNLSADSGNNVTVSTPAFPNIDLSKVAVGAGGFVITGQQYDHAGTSVASAGDVNGDGLSDLIVGAPNNYGERSYVVFGQTSTTAINLSAVATGQGGFVINGQDVGDRSGYSVAGAGDINGDGLSDLIIGAPYSDPASGSYGGRSYIVFGQTNTSAINLSAIANGIGGFVVNGQVFQNVEITAGEHSGTSVASAGDVNGDGLADLIVGAPVAVNVDNGSMFTNSGRSYVVFGKTNTTAIDLSAIALGSGGFAINGQFDQNSSSGSSVASAGDVNGDGFADLIIGAPYSSDGGRSYVVFGKSTTGAIDLSAIANGTGGFVISGLSGHASSRAGTSVASAGDVNGDGLSDLFVGALARGYGGGGYVVFGKTGTSEINLVDIAAGTGGGFAINTEEASNYTGWSVANAGDINGDGLADLIIGAPRSDTDVAYAGRSYVVFGQTGTTAINLSAVATGVGGFVIDGESAAFGYSGSSVASAGDVNGDGLADLIIGAHNSSDGGRSYVIFGSTTGAFAETAVDQLGTGGNNNLIGTVVAETLVGGEGNDTLTGNGGADVLYGGAGDDNLLINASNISELIASLGAGNDTNQLARIDGGSGVDTIVLSGSGLLLDLTAIANQGGSSPNSSSRIESIECIDLTGSGNNTLTLDVKDVMDMAGMNSFNNANGWLDGSYNLAAGGTNRANPEQRHQLIIDGNAGDVVNSSGWGTAVGTVIHNGDTYNVYNQGDYEQLLIGVDLTQVVT